MLRRIGAAVLLEGWSIETRLTAMVLSLAVPLNLVILAVIWHLIQSAGELQRVALLHTARSVSAAVDAQLDKHMTLALALARSPALLSDDLSAFEAEARRAFASASDMWIIVADLGGQQIVNTAAEPGAKLPKRPPRAVEAQQRAFAVGAPLIAGVWEGPFTGNMVATIEVPIFRNGEPFRLLAVPMDVRSFLKLLNTQRLPADWLAGIVTHEGRFVARVPNGERTQNQLASDGWRKIQSKEGLFEFPSLEGDEIVHANTHSRLSGWAVGVAVKKTLLTSIARDTVRWAMVTGGGLSALSLLIAVVIARRITGSIDELREKAAALVDGSKPVFAPKSPEIQEVWTALSTAAADRERLEAERRRVAEQFHRVYERALAGIAIFDWDGRVLRCNPAFCNLTGYAEDELVGRHFSTLIHPDDVAADVERGRRLRAGEAASFEMESRYLHKSGRPVWARKIISTLPDAGGQPAQVFALALDITERKRADDKIDLLIHELNHRSKNLLGLVQTIVSHTAGPHSGEFAAALAERIQALAASQDLLVKSQWQGVDLEALALSQLAHFQDLIGKRITLEGPPLKLSAGAAQAIGMALHELSTNAAKYGALSNDTGHVAIAWSRQGSDGTGSLRLSWTERDGPAVVPPSRHGFGTTVIFTVPERQLGCKVTLDFAPDGFSWHLDGPVARVLESASPAAAGS
jgi:PAS domain S-box-containing protein